MSELSLKARKVIQDFSSGETDGMELTILALCDEIEKLEAELASVFIWNDQKSTTP